MKLTKFEKETIIRSSEGETVYYIFTYNRRLKKRLAYLAAKYPEHCILDDSSPYGGVSYIVDKRLLTIRLDRPRV